MASRADVLVAEFAQQRHMLLFARADGGGVAFTSTRCKDGDLVRGVPIAPIADAVHYGDRPANVPAAVDPAAWAFLPPPAKKRF